MLFAEEAASSGNNTISIGASLVIAVMTIAAGWRVLNKAGLPGWGVLIPFYNAYLLLKAAQKPGWWLVLLFIPLVNIVVFILVMSGLSKSFGKGLGFTIGLLVVHPFFLMALGFGSAQHVAPRRS